MTKKLGLMTVRWVYKLFVRDDGDSRTQWTANPNKAASPNRTLLTRTYSTQIQSVLAQISPQGLKSLDSLGANILLGSDDLGPKKLVSWV